MAGHKARMTEANLGTASGGANRGATRDPKDSTQEAIWLNTGKPSWLRSDALVLASSPQEATPNKDCSNSYNHRESHQESDGLKGRTLTWRANTLLQEPETGTSDVQAP